MTAPLKLACKTRTRNMLGCYFKDVYPITHISLYTKVTFLALKSNINNKSLITQLTIFNVSNKNIDINNKSLVTQLIISNVSNRNM